jgi:hypothetical protein
MGTAKSVRERSRIVTFNKLHHGNPNGDSYDLEVGDNNIKIECYLIGSILGGTGTDCSHTIGSKNIPAFLSSNGWKSQEDLINQVATYSAQGWKKLHISIADHQTESFIWEETDWSDLNN